MTVAGGGEGGLADTLTVVVVWTTATVAVSAMAVATAATDATLRRWVR